MDASIYRCCDTTSDMLCKMLLCWPLLCGIWHMETDASKPPFMFHIMGYHKQFYHTICLILSSCASTAIVIIIPHIYFHSYPTCCFYTLPSPIRPLPLSTSSSHMRMHLSLLFWLFSPFQNPRFFSAALPLILLSAPISAIIYPPPTASSAYLIQRILFVLNAHCVSPHHPHIHGTPPL